MFAQSVLVATVIWVSSPQSFNLPAPRQFLLTCSGTMRTTSDSGSRISAHGLIDLAHMRVSGFGFGGAPIQVVTAALIGFGSPTASGATGDSVEGSVDRRTGNVKIVVRSPADPAGEAITMDLDCSALPPMS